MFFKTQNKNWRDLWRQLSIQNYCLKIFDVFIYFSSASSTPDFPPLRYYEGLPAPPEKVPPLQRRFALIALKLLSSWEGLYFSPNRTHFVVSFSKVWLAIHSLYGCRLRRRSAPRLYLRCFNLLLLLVSEAVVKGNMVMPELEMESKLWPKNYILGIKMSK